MALSASEEALVRLLLDQQAALISLANSESTIISKLGATKVTLADLVAASVVNDSDLLLARQGVTEKTLTPSLFKSYLDNHFTNLTTDQTVDGKKTFSQHPVLPGNAIGDLQAVPKQQLDAAVVALAIPKTTTTKLPNITVTPSAGALTVTSDPIYIDIPSATLTGGAPATLLTTTATLVIPSGATLGATTTVATDIAIVEINNAGTAEKAVINLSGGVDLSERGLISTTAISTASDSANVFYSTTARTNVPYKVIGFFTAINTAGAWGSPTLVRGAGGMVLPGAPMMRKTLETTLTGAAVDFTVPSWAKKMTVAIDEADATLALDIKGQLGTLGGVIVSGYDLSNMSFSNGSANTAATATDGIFGTSAVNATATVRGSATLYKESEVKWGASSSLYRKVDAVLVQGNSSHTLPGELTTLRIASLNGTFTGGTVTVIFEGY